MFELFDAEARRAVVLAQEEARELNHHYIGTEHLLLGVRRVMDGATKAAPSLPRVRQMLSYEAARDAVLKRIGQGVDAPTGLLPFTPNLDFVLLRAAVSGYDSVGLELLLAAIVRFEDENPGEQCVGQRILTDLGIDLAELSELLPKPKKHIKFFILASGYDEGLDFSEEKDRLQIEHHILEVVLTRLESRQARVERRLAELADEDQSDEAASG